MKEKKKKPFFLRWWFILLAVIVVGGIVLSPGDGNEKIVWDDIIMGDQLPEPPKSKGQLHINSAIDLHIEIRKVTDKQYNNYVESCKEMGFVVDATSGSESYSAYNTEGYKLDLSHYSEDMRIYLDAPMEMSAITWPTGSAGKQLPIPKSTIGKFSYENEDSFYVYVGNTSREDYTEYVSICAEKGFTIDYSKGDDYYSADNAGGWHVHLAYEGNNIMRISIDAPQKAASGTNSNTTTPVPANPTPSEKPAPETNQSPSTPAVDGLRSDFKAAMDSYETFMNKYVAFMKKYKANPTDMTLLADYADYMNKYTKAMSDFEAWNGKDMTAAETTYYLEVQSRVTKKLLEVAQ
ncbi:MAG: hypothetical protein IJP02_06545 [Oscillospiraceae bacterium]|nr:hypothetical protein [Oscillospiraceae bacterium]